MSSLTRRTFLKFSTATVAGTVILGALPIEVWSEPPKVTTLQMYTRAAGRHSARLVRAVWIGTAKPGSYEGKPDHWEGSPDGKTWGRLLRPPDFAFLTP